MSVANSLSSNDSSSRFGETMKAIVLSGVRRLEVRNVPRPVISSHEVLVRVAAVGLCGTDAHIFAGHANYNTNHLGHPIPLELQPQILGHEITGIVDKVGGDVRDLVAGDRVVIDQGLNCVSRRREILCEYCRTGDSHQCELYREHGITGLPGGLADYIAVPAVNAIKMESELDFVEAALVEPLGCVMHSSDAVANVRSRFSLNADHSERRVRAVLICGAGPAGLLFTQYLRSVLGYEGSLIVTDPNELKRAMALRYGATAAIDASTSDLVEVVRENTGGKGVEYLIEASGSGVIFSSIPGLIRKQATVLMYGHGHSGSDLSLLNNIFFKEPAIIASVGASGGFGPDGRPLIYARSLKLIEQKKIDVEPLITHKYTTLADVESALASDMQSNGYVKGVVSF